MMDFLDLAGRHFPIGLSVERLVVVAACHNAPPRSALLSVGSAATVSYSPSRLLALLKEWGAARFAVAHNHPGTLALPSSRDLIADQALHRAAAYERIEMVDSFIFADPDQLWRASRAGLIDRWSAELPPKYRARSGVMTPAISHGLM